MRIDKDHEGASRETWEESVLVDLQAEYERMPLPEALDSHIRMGIASGRAYRRRQNRIRWSILAASIILALFWPIRVSPAYAAVVSRIPGLDYIVRLINYDHGLVSAVQNDFVQHINLSDEHDDIIFTVKDVIMDESRAVIFYSVRFSPGAKAKSGGTLPRLAKVELSDEAGNALKKNFSISWSFYGEPEVNGTEAVNSIDITWGKDMVLPDNLLIQVRLEEGFKGYSDDPASVSAQTGKPLPDAAKGAQAPMTEKPVKPEVLAPVWKVLVPIDKEKLRNLKQVYALNQTIEVEGQKVFIGEVTIYPTRIAVEVKYDSANTKKILAFDDLALLDEQGRQVTRMTNGITATGFPGEAQTLFLQSNYFSDAKELYLQGRSLRAIDRKDERVQVDVEKGLLLNNPDGRLTLKEVRRVGQTYELSFLVRKDPVLDKSYSFGVFSHRFVDAEGGEHWMNGTSTMSSNEAAEDEIHLDILADSLPPGPLTLFIDDYPSRIQEAFRIKVK